MRLEKGFEMTFEAEKDVYIDCIRVGPYSKETIILECEGLPENAEMRLQQINNRKFAYITLNQGLSDLKLKIY